MMMWDKKKQMNMLIARRKPDGEKIMSAEMKPEVVKTDDGELDGRHMAAQEMLGALGEKSPEKFMSALSNFIDLHSSKPAPKGE